MTELVVSAREQGIAGCHTCGLAVQLGSRDEAECPRCGSEVHYRKQNSISRAWAYLIAAFVMYIPANTEPMMRTTALGNTEGDTIISGVIYFLDHGEWYLAVVIFAASVMLPLAKIIAIGYLLVCSQRAKVTRRRKKTDLYKLAEVLGKWSMLDIFVVALMVALIQLGNLTSIHPGAACIAFASVVILTMFAEMAMEPKLIWDRNENND